ncbi:MAG: hypothetical protein HPY74_05405 [Firmicutes bacterium]|nr:hypothetical protein [Bacillota bacterium]
MILIGGVDVFILLTIVLLLNLMHAEIALLHSLLLTFSSFTLTACISMLIVRKVRLRNTVILLCTVWVIILMILMTATEDIRLIFTDIYTGTWAAVLCAGLLVLTFEIRNLVKNYGFERR